MKKFLVAVIISPILYIGTANAQVVPDPDPDLLDSRERALGMYPWVNPEWTWMTKFSCASDVEGDRPRHHHWHR